MRSRLARFARILRPTATTLLVGIALVLSVRCGAATESVTVDRNTYLRHDPSTHHPPIRLLHHSQKLELLDPAPSNHFLHVRTSPSEEGWVWSRNVHIVAGTPTGQPATSISTMWAKPQPNSTSYSAEGIDCGPAGNRGDSATNLRKNRTDVPGAYHAVTFDAIAKLPYPNAPRSRARWSGAELKEIEPYEGVALTVTGDLVGLRVEGAETTNCGMTARADVDWHMWITAQPQAPKGDAIVVETTPRVRKDHPKWAPAALKPWINSTDQVRISGWLMMDPEHPNQVGNSRVTIWEIHPITKIEVFQSGAWVNLDAIP